MAERRENHPMTLCSQTQCLKKRSSHSEDFLLCCHLDAPLKAFLLRVCKKKLTNPHFTKSDSVGWAARAGPQVPLCFAPETDFLTPSI